MKTSLTAHQSYVSAYQLPYMPVANINDAMNQGALKLSAASADNRNWAMDCNYDIFIAHAGQGTDTAEALYTLLKERTRVFVDSEVVAARRYLGLLGKAGRLHG
jgi:hypothetical protein